MQYTNLLIEEKRKLLTLVNKKFVKLDFSKVTSVLDNNMLEPRWMDVYILIYKCNLPPDIIAYNILLSKLSTPILRFYFKSEDKRYVANINEFMLSRYVWYLITNDKTEYSIETQFIPKKEYIKEILKFNRFFDSGMYLKHIDENEFQLMPTKYRFDNIDNAVVLYNKCLDAYDIFRSLKLKHDDFIMNIDLAMEYGKDKRMIATLSNILSYFDFNFMFKDNYITLKGTNFKITNEAEADRFQVKLVDCYQFFRNVVNTENNSITWTIPELKSGETATVQYKLKLKQNFDSNIVDKILNTNEKVDLKYTDFNDAEVSKTSDVSIGFPTVSDVSFSLSTTLSVSSLSLTSFCPSKLLF